MLNRPGVTFGSSPHNHRQRGEVAEVRCSSLSRDGDNNKGVRVNNDSVGGGGGIPRFAAPRQRERLPVRRQMSKHHHPIGNDVPRDPHNEVVFQEHRDAAAEEGVDNDDDDDDNDAPIEGSLHADGGLRDFSQVTLSQLSDGPSVRSFRSYRTASSQRSTGTTTVAAAMLGGGGRVLGATNDGSDLLYDQHNRDSDRPREIARRQGGGGGRGLNLPERRSVLAGQQQNLHQQQPVMSQHSSRRRREDHDDTDSHSIRSSQPLLSQLHTTAHRPTSNGDSSRNTTSSDGSKSNGRRKNDDNNAQAGRRPASSGSRGDRSRQSKADTRMYEDDTINARLLQQSQPLLSQLPNVSTLASIAPPKRPTTTTGERQIIPSQRERLRGGSKILDNQEQRQGVMSRLLSHGNPKNTIPTTNRYHQPYPSSSLGSTRHPPSVLGGSTKAIRTSGVISSTLAHTLSTPSRAFRSMTSLAARTVSSAGLIAMSPFRGIGAITGREGFRTTIGARLTSAFAASKLSNSTSSSTTAGGISMFTRPTSGSSILASVSDRKSSAAAESLTVTTGSSILPLSSTVSNGYKDTSSASAIADTFPPTVEERGDEGACSVVGHQYASANVGVKTNDNDHDESKELAKTRSGLTLDIQSKTDEIIAATRELNHKHEQLQQSKQDLIDISERARQEMKDERERLEALQKSIDAKLGMMQSSIDAFSYKSASVTHDHELTIRTLVNKSMNDLRQESSQATDAITNQLQERMKSQLPSDVRALIDVEARKYMVEVIDGIVDAAKSDFQVWVDGIRDSPIAAEKENVQPEIRTTEPFDSIPSESTFHGGQNSPLSESRVARSESLTPLPRDARSTSTTPFSRKATPLQNNHATGKLHSVQSSTLVRRDIDFESSTHADITACGRQTPASATSTPSSALAKFVVDRKERPNDQTQSNKHMSSSTTSSSSSSSEVAKVKVVVQTLTRPEKKSRKSEIHAKSKGHITPPLRKRKSDVQDAPLTKKNNRSPKVDNATLPSGDVARKRSHSEVMNSSKSPRRAKRLKEINRLEQFSGGDSLENATSISPKPSQVTPNENNTPIARMKDDDASVSTSLICSPSSGVVGEEERRASESNDFDTLLGTSVTVPNRGDHTDNDDVFDLEIDSDSAAAAAKPDKRSFTLFLPFSGFGNRNNSSRHKSSKTMSKKKKKKNKRKHEIDCFDFSQRSD